jgi:hypothetical protein
MALYCAHPIITRHNPLLGREVVSPFCLYSSPAIRHVHSCHRDAGGSMLLTKQKSPTPPSLCACRDETWRPRDTRLWFILLLVTGWDEYLNLCCDRPIYGPCPLAVPRRRRRRRRSPSLHPSRSSLSSPRPLPDRRSPCPRLRRVRRGSAAQTTSRTQMIITPPSPNSRRASAASARTRAPSARPPGRGPQMRRRSARRRWRCTGATGTSARRTWAPATTARSRPTCKSTSSSCASRASLSPPRWPSPAKATLSRAGSRASCVALVHTTCSAQIELYSSRPKVYISPPRWCSQVDLKRGVATSYANERPCPQASRWTPIPPPPGCTASSRTRSTRQPRRTATPAARSPQRSRRRPWRRG